VRWWRSGRNRDDPGPEPEPARRTERDAASPQKHDGVLSLQRTFGNQAVQRLVPQEIGEPIEETDRAALESSFGQDLGDVRVHRDDAAAAVAAAADATALATGRHIYFAPGAYGLGALAHEVAHVIQQERAAAITSGDESAALEHDADAAASRVAGGRAAEVAHPAAAPGVQRQAAPGSGASRGSALTLLPTASLTVDGFEVDSAALSAAQKEKLDAFATQLLGTLSTAPDSIVTIVGYADAPGTDVHNLALGQRRADAVVGYLGTKGVPTARLHATSLGEALPAVPTKGYDARNRRVEINVIERTFFKPAAPPAPAPAPVVVPPAPAPKPIDLTYHPRPLTPEEEIEENIHRNELIWQLAQQAKAHEKPHAGTSIAGAAGRIARDIVKKLGLPKWVEDRAASLAEDLPSKGAQSVFDQIAGDKSLDPSSKNAIKAVIEAITKLEVGGR
jgi:outer membrane protein OmpA-like peptidoglycan-associated protein